MTRRGKIVVLAITLFVALAAVAADGAGKLTVYSPLQVNGTKIAAGDYKLNWTGTGDTVQVTFKNSGTEVASASAKLIESTSKPSRNTVVDDNGALKEIHFAGRKTVLVFNQ